MRYFIDEEFIEDGQTIGLISIGIVAEDGREYYAQSCEFDRSKASDWVKQNVLPHLQVCPYTVTQEYTSGEFALDYIGAALRRHKQGQCIDQIYGIRHRCPWRTREQLKQDILSFMDVEVYGKPELWGYYSAYDHVAFSQIFGTMMDLPNGFPMYTRDIKQWCDALGNPRLPEQGKDEHNALSDARWNKRTWEFLKECEEFCQWRHDEPYVVDEIRALLAQQKSTIAFTERETIELLALLEDVRHIERREDPEEKRIGTMVTLILNKIKGV